ncbi:permease [Phenylobacterium sp.]|uniref:permease n=1 Tax=Phenylobacterium sp. TaxID=1871053 RepID=UPI003563271F
MIVAALLIPLILISIFFSVVLARACLAAGATRPRLEALAMSAVANFFDTLGIGSFATTMAWMRVRRLVPDRLIPSTLVTGYNLPTLLQSGVFLVLLGVKVDPVLLGGCIAAMIAGGLVGVRLVTRTPVRTVQAVVGAALLIAAGFYALANLKLMPAGGTATGLPPELMAVAIAAHFVLGVLVNFGVGNYAPTLAMLSLFGMDPRLAFPIMASSAAFCIAGASVRLVRHEAELDLRIVLAMALGGIPAVLVAAFAVREMPLDLLRWLVVAVVTYAAITLLYSAFRGTLPVAAAEA